MAAGGEESYIGLSLTTAASPNDADFLLNDASITSADEVKTKIGDYFGAGNEPWTDARRRLETEDL